MAKEIIITVASGICNRMFLIASALRITEKYGHKLTVFWSERTGRYGMVYYGDINSDWDDYFERMEGVATYGIEGSIKFQDKPIAIDQESLMPDPPIINGTRVIHPPLPTHFRGEIDKFMYIMNSPKIVNPKEDLIIIQKLTKPFGLEGDNMIKYLNYIEKIGIHQKDNYLTELSKAVKQFRPKNLETINKIVKQFEKFDEVWGIHIRGSDLVQQTKVDRETAICQIIQSTSENVGFFVASDEPVDWIEEIMGKDRMISYDHEAKCDNSIEGTKHALVDLFVLSKCNKLYGTSGSSFSMMAWLLSDLDEYTIHS